MGLAMLLGAVLATTSAPPNSLAPYTEQLERLPLGTVSEAPQVRVEPLLGRLLLTGVTRESAKRLRSRLCPKVTAEGGTTLECRSRRVHAEVTKADGSWVLEIRQLRGLSVATPEEVAFIPFSLASLALDESCPGRTAAARGECAIARGDLAEAKTQFEAAQDDPMGKSLASLRLGDLALLRGAPGEALAHYQDVGVQSVLYRVAGSRICELGGRCLDEAKARRAYDLTGLPPAMADDVRLRRARLDAYLERDAAVLEGLLGAADSCTRVAPVCQRLLLSTLRPGDTGILALESYLEAPYRDHPSLRLRLARAAAEVAQAQGVPRVAAMILSASTPVVAPSDLPAHLLRTVELYWASGDRARASAVFEFAQSRLPRGQRTGGRWSKLGRSLASAAFAEPLPAASIAISKPPIQEAEALLARAAVAVSAASAAQEAKR